jgi:hypothetical protein
MEEVEPNIKTSPLAKTRVVLDALKQQVRA